MERRIGDGAARRIAGRRVHSGRVINLDVDTVQWPTGAVSELEVIRHPGAAAIVPLLSPRTVADPIVLLLRQYRYVVDTVLYEIPAGRLEPGELPVDCAARELREETGCVAGVLEPLMSVIPTPGFADERIQLFLATELTGGEAALEADEFITVVPTQLSEALEMIRDGRITDAKTALGLLFVAGFVLQR